MLPARLIDARQKGHQQLIAEINGVSRVYDLCRLAFLLEPHPLTVTEWFEKPIRGLDPQFLVNRDKVDAGRIAALLLRDRIAGAQSIVPLAVLSASFCGKRHSAERRCPNERSKRGLGGRGPQSAETCLY